jgi:hypothetical protein
MDLVYGARSLGEMGRSLANASFPPPNPEIVNELLYGIWSDIAFPLCLITIALLFAEFIAIAIAWLRAPLSFRSSAVMAITLSLVAMFAIALHWAAFKRFGLLLPQARTGLFFAPLLTLALAAAVDALRRQPRFEKWSVPGVAVLALCSVYFLTCLRFHYFQEWKFNEDSGQVFWVARDIEKRCGVQDFVTEWHYVSSLNFYRRQYENDTLKPFTAVTKDSFPRGKNAYIFWYDDGEPLIRSEHLSIWYHNHDTGATVAVRGCADDRAALSQHQPHGME